ncbi:hypothetical protein LTR22_022672 [Elasticomyces elasticus]|nr:hypothetical protein LTR22_022672 [Elasticomyces elasticus]KAK4918775.1 hypothetical protein LTR49_013562 [Elasticomyces elasticus]
MAGYQAVRPCSRAGNCARRGVGTSEPGQRDQATRESIDKLRVTGESEAKSMAEANRLFDKHIGNHSIRDGMPQSRVPRGPIGQQVRPAGNTHTPLQKLAIARILENDADTGMSILADSVGGQKTQTAMGSYSGYGPQGRAQQQARLQQAAAFWSARHLSDETFGGVA